MHEIVVQNFIQANLIRPTQKLWFLSLIVMLEDQKKTT